MWTAHTATNYLYKDSTEYIYRNKWYRVIKESPIRLKKGFKPHPYFSVLHVSIWENIKHSPFSSSSNLIEQIFPTSRNW